MKFDEFVKLRDIKIRDNEHLKIIKCFYPYLRSVSGDEQLLPSLIGNILGIDLSNVTVETACFNGVNDGSDPPYDKVDLYLKFSNNIKAFVYGRKQEHLVELKVNEYAIFLLANEITSNVIKTGNNYILYQIVLKKNQGEMIDRSIPYYNLFLKCNEICITPVLLPEGYSFKTYNKGDEKHWAELEYEIGDFSSIEEAEAYFKTNYCNQIDELKKRCVFIVDDNDKVVGSCIAWHDLKDNATAASLHWLVVSPKHQGKHIGLALCQKVMEIFKEFEEAPIYIHTQPWSYKAIFLYTKLGFKIQKTDTFSHYENQYDKALETLKSILTESQVNQLISYSE